MGVELQAISIFSISLWICKPDRSSRHQWLSSPWNSRKREQQRGERGGREGLPTDVLIQQRRIISVMCNEYPSVHVRMCAWGCAAPPQHCGEGSLCRLARLQMREEKNNWLNPIVCRKSSISVICSSSLFHYIMQIPTRSVWREMYSSWARQCDSVTVFLPQMLREKTPLSCVCAQSRSLHCAPPPAPPSAPPCCPWLCLWVERWHGFSGWGHLTASSFDELRWEKSSMLEMIFIHLLTHHTFTVRIRLGLGVMDWSGWLVTVHSSINWPYYQ